MHPRLSSVYLLLVLSLFCLVFPPAVQAEEEEEKGEFINFYEYYQKLPKSRLLDCNLGSKGEKKITVLVRDGFHPGSVDFLHIEGKTVRINDLIEYDEEREFSYVDSVENALAKPEKAYQERLAKKPELDWWQFLSDRHEGDVKGDLWAACIGKKEKVLFLYAEPGAGRNIRTRVLRYNSITKRYDYTSYVGPTFPELMFMNQREIILAGEEEEDFRPEKLQKYIISHYISHAKREKIASRTFYATHLPKGKQSHAIPSDDQWRRVESFTDNGTAILETGEQLPVWTEERQ